MLNRIFRSTLIAALIWLAAMQPGVAQIIPNPYTSPTPTIPPIIGPPPTPTATPTTPPVGPVLASLKQADPQSARAVVRYGQNSVLTLANDRGQFQKVALQPNEVITVVLTLTPKDYGKAADVQVLDGGAISTDLPELPELRDDILPTPRPTATPFIAPVSSNSTTSGSPTPPLPVITPPPVPGPTDFTERGAVMTISEVGELIFRFKPGADVGLHRVSIMVGGNQYFFQFWRQDPNAPNTNPRMLRAY